MTAASRVPITAFLLRAGLLTAALAIIAGIFGMHIMTGAHSMTSAHSMPLATADTHRTPAGHASHAGHAGYGSHAGHGTELTPRAAMTAHPVTDSPSSCSTAGGCPEMSGDASCVLAPGNTSLAASFLPEAAAHTVPDPGCAAGAGTNYSFSPDSPSPGDLCISRT